MGRLRGSLATAQPVRLQDISPGGALVELSYPLPVDSQHTVQLGAHGHVSVLDVRVRHVRSAIEFGRYLIGLELSHLHMWLTRPWARALVGTGRSRSRFPAMTMSHDSSETAVGTPGFHERRKHQRRRAPPTSCSIYRRERRDPGYQRGRRSGSPRPPGNPGHRCQLRGLLTVNRFRRSWKCCGSPRALAPASTKNTIWASGSAHWTNTAAAHSSGS
jgi:hypothetical protein